MLTQAAWYAGFRLRQDERIERNTGALCVGCHVNIVAGGESEGSTRARNLCLCRTCYKKQRDEWVDEE